MRVLSVWGQLIIIWDVTALWGPFFVQRHHLNFQRYKQSNWLYRWRVRRCVSTFFCGEKLNTRLKDTFSPYKFRFWKLGGFYAWTKIGPLDSGQISPSPLKPIELGEIGPESNGPSEVWERNQNLFQKGSIFEKLTLNTSIFLSFWSVKSWISFRCHMAVDLSYYGVSRGILGGYTLE